MTTSQRFQFSLRSIPTIIPPPIVDDLEGFNSKINGCRTTYFESASQSIWSSLGLLALGQPGQAHLLLMQSSEVILKGIVQDILNSGISEVGRRNTNVLRAAAKLNSDFPVGQLKTLLGENGFKKCFEFVNQSLGFLNDYKSCYVDLNRIRNQIAHSGSDINRNAQYVEDILMRILPLIEEVFEFYLNARLADRITSSVMRELMVARKFLTNEQRSFRDWGIGLVTFQRAYFAKTNLNDVANREFDPWRNDEDQTNYSYDKSLISGMGDCLLNDEVDVYPECRICSGHCFVSVTLPRADVPIDKIESVKVAALACPQCQLYLDNRLSDLADAHFGSICEATIGNEEWVFFLKALN